ncbi:MAG: Hsp20/alpha crystallin family protein [Candidatus Auribacterota bacterium]
MTKKAASIILSAAVLAAGFLVLNPGIPSFAEGDDIEELKKQIETLQNRVAELEAAQDQQKNSRDTTRDPLGVFRHQPQRWDPFEEIARMQEEMDRMFRNSFAFGGNDSRGMFRSDMFYDDSFAVKEEPDKYIIEFDMAGLDQGKVDIQVNEHAITVKGEGMEEKTAENENQVFRSKNYSTFMKSIPVPEDADTAKMETRQEKDKLIIILPKKII